MLFHGVSLCVVRPLARPKHLSGQLGRGVPADHWHLLILDGTFVVLVVRCGLHPG